MIFSEQMPPSYAEEREHCFNMVLGMHKVMPLVDLTYDPVTPAWSESSHRAIVALVTEQLRPGGNSERVRQACQFRWFDLELASCRGVCIDRFHLRESVAVPLWETRLQSSVVFETERSDANRNIPALLLRRIFRAEILFTNIDYYTTRNPTQLVQPTTTSAARTSRSPLIIDAVSRFCAIHEQVSRDAASFTHLDLVLIDLQWLFAPFTDTIAYLFDDEEPLFRVLGGHGKTSFFETWHIPPPSSDVELMRALREGDWALLKRDYQLYTALLWRLVKGHTVMAALRHLLTTADRNDVFHVDYSYSSLKVIEYNVQLFIDTHRCVFAWALGDGAWSDAEWLAGPGARTVVESWRREKQISPESSELPPCIDVGGHSPIVQFYPHCRDVAPCESELPDISTAISYSNLTRDVNLKPSNPTLAQAFIHLLCKLMMHRCLIRNFINIVLRYLQGKPPKDGKPPFLGYPSIKHYLMLVIRCGLLGNWRFATSRPNFAQRIAVEYTFVSLSVPTRFGEHPRNDVPHNFYTVPSSHAYQQQQQQQQRESVFQAVSAMLSEEDGSVRGASGEHPTRVSYQRLPDATHSDSLTRWILNNDLLCFHIMKEHYVYAFQGRRSLDIVISRYGQWGRYKNLTMMRMDHIRHLIDTEGGFDMAVASADWKNPLVADPERIARHKKLMAAMTPIFDRFYRADKKCFVKLYKGYWLRVFVRQMNAAVTLLQKKKLPSGYQRVGMPGDDNPAQYVANGYKMTSTRDLLTPEEIRVGERMLRSGYRRATGRGEDMSDDDDDDDEEEDEDDEDEDGEGDEDEDVDKDDNDDLLDDDDDNLDDLAGLSDDLDDPMEVEPLDHATNAATPATNPPPGVAAAPGGRDMRLIGGTDDPAVENMSREIRSLFRDAQRNTPRIYRSVIPNGVAPTKAATAHSGATVHIPANSTGVDTYANEYTIAPLAKQLRTAARAVTDVDFDLMDMVARDCGRRRQSTWFMETRWLIELFGVSEDSIQRLKSFYAYYETYDMPDHQLLERSYNILRRSPRDFYVIRLYIYMLLWHSQQQEMALPLETRHRQLVALRRRWGVPDQQDLPRDIGWRWFCPGSRRWFSSEANAPRHKVDTFRDRQRHLRDGGFEQTRAQQMVRHAKVQVAMRQVEKEAEAVYSVNMEHATYNDLTGRLYARRNTDPNLSRLQALANIVGKSGASSEVNEVLARGRGGTLVVPSSARGFSGGSFGGDSNRQGVFADMLSNSHVAEIFAEINDLVSPDTAEENTSGAVSVKQDSNNQQPPSIGVHPEGGPLAKGVDDFGVHATGSTGNEELGHVHPEQLEREVREQYGQPQKMFETSDLKIVVAIDQQGVRRQWGWLSEETRKSYRQSTEAAYSMYDSGFRTPLVPIDMIGRIVLMNERPYVLCAKCGILTLFEASKIAGNEGPTCGLHDPHALFKSNRRFLIANSQTFTTKPSTTMRQIISLGKAPVPFDPRRLTQAPAAAHAGQGTASITATSQSQHDQHCHFCDMMGPMTGQLAHKLTRHLVVKESTGEQLSIHVCARDQRFAFGPLNSTRAGGFPSYDHVLNAVTRGRTQTMLGVREKALREGQGATDRFSLNNPNLKQLHTLSRGKL